MKRDKLISKYYGEDHDYEDDIKEWRKSSEYTNSSYNINKLIKIPPKKLKNKLKHNDDSLKTNHDLNKLIFIPARCEKIINLNKYYRNPDEYFADTYALMNGFASYIESPDDYDLHVDFRYSNDHKVYKMGIIHFTFNMIIWMPYFILGVPIDREHTFMPETFNNKSYIDFINNKIIEPYKYLVTHNQMSSILAKMYDMFIYICEKYDMLITLSFSIYDFISKWDDERFYKLNHVKIPKDMSTSDSEKLLNDTLDEYITLIKEGDDDNSLKSMLRSEQGVNKKQLREFAISAGFKPDLSGNTQPIKPKTNQITYGYRNPTDMVVDAIGGRKATVLSLNIADSGYLARTFAKSSMDIKLCPDPDFDCGSVNYYEKYIETKNDLKDMHGRWYLHKGKKLRQLNSNDGEDLIGQIIKFRSPATCAGGERGICKYCYGSMYYQNLDINVGLNSSLKLSERSYQNTMSAKHILNTNTETVSFNEHFSKFFDIIEGYRILVKEDTIEDLDNYEIVINREDIQQDDLVNDFSANMYVKKFYVRERESDEDSKRRSYEIYECNGIDIYIGDEIINYGLREFVLDDKYKNKKSFKVPFSKICLENDLFYMVLKNNELTKPLNEIRKLIEKGKEINGVDSISELIDKLDKLMKSGGIHVPCIHIEILCKNLIRDPNNILKNPDFTIENPPYTLITIHSSILNSPSLIDSITFERLKDQFRNPITYEKNGSSMLDIMYTLQ